MLPFSVFRKFPRGLSPADYLKPFREEARSSHKTIGFADSSGWRCSEAVKRNDFLCAREGLRMKNSAR